MNKIIHKKLWTVVICSLFLAACSVTGQVEHQEIDFSVGQAKNLEMELELVVGSFRLTDNTDNSLLKGSISYNVDEWAPEIEKRLDISRGQIVIKQGQGKQTIIGDELNHWDLRVLPTIPFSLKTDQGKASSVLHPREMLIQDIEQISSSGDMTISLHGDFAILESVFLESKSGAVDLSLSGALPTLSSLILKNTSGGTRLDMWGQYQDWQILDIGTQSGGVKVNLEPEVTTFIEATVETVTGDITLTLDGSWVVGSNFSLHSESGTITLLVSSHLPVEVLTDNNLQSMIVEGFQTKDSVFFNSQVIDTKTPVIKIKANTTSGNIILQPK